MQKAHHHLGLLVTEWGAQKPPVRRMAKLRGGAIALPENNPAKLIRLRRLLRFSPSNCSRTATLSFCQSSAPIEASTDREGCPRKRAKSTRSITAWPYCA